ncbi:MAG TPA: hypothetical protein VLX85_04850 [Stellaceae bacterium]|nr:hypothetical protein [Stellaceae bacterium]
MLQVLPTAGIAQPAQGTVSPALPVAGPVAAPAAPLEPARRVTANRDSGRADLQQPPQSQRSQHHSQTRGRLLDLFV